MGEVLTKGNYVHGGSYTRLYRIWCAMKSRCYNPNRAGFHRYGQRGICVCNEWQTFGGFREWAMSSGYQDDLTLDRENNDGNYCPDNCRWITLKEQQNNRCDTIHIQHNGETHTLSEWAEITGIPRTALWKRIYQRKLTVEEALTMPLQKTNTKKEN